MKFTKKTCQAKFIKRYQRFFADAELKGEIVVAHVPNTGSLKTVIREGASCLLTETDNPERKLKYTLEAIQAESKAWVGVNTSWPNLIVGEAFANRTFRHWHQFDKAQKEVKISSESRIDWVFSNSQTGKRHYLEVKNTTLAIGDITHSKGVAQFPDAVTTRGQKHLRELMRLKAEGHSAEIFFAVQRTDCQEFSPAEEIDPEYASLLRQASAQGVLVTAAEIEVSPQGIQATGRLLAVKL